MFCAVGHASKWLLPGHRRPLDRPGRRGGCHVTTSNTNNTPYDSGDDTLVGDSGALFANTNSVDKGTLYKGDGRYSDGGYNGSTSTASSATTHPQVTCSPPAASRRGSYRLQVTTSSANNDNVNAENMFGNGAVTNAVAPRVHGTVRMAMYNNLNGAQLLFYLGPDRHSFMPARRWRIRLFDPGARRRHAALH